MSLIFGGLCSTQVLLFFILSELGRIRKELELQNRIALRAASLEQKP